MLCKITEEFPLYYYIRSVRRIELETMKCELEKVRKTIFYTVNRSTIHTFDNLLGKIPMGGQLFRPFVVLVGGQLSGLKPDWPRQAHL